MKRTIFLLLVLALPVFAAPTCERYQHSDYTWTNNYQPQLVPDSLLANCNNLQLTDPEICNVIQSSNLTIEEKKQLVLNGFITNNGFPPFSEAQQWNNQIQFATPPENVSIKSGNYIKDAWLKIAAISPSVIDLNESRTYINTSGKVRVGYGFEFVVPRESFSSDCRTDYQVCGYNYNLDVYNNGVKLNKTSENEAVFEVQQHYHGARNDFTATLNVSAQYLIHHYRMQSHCVGAYRYRYCFSTCDYYSTEDRRGSLTLADNKTTYLYRFISFENTFIDTFTNGLANGWLFIVSNEDFNNIKFTIDNSFLNLQSRQYQLRYSLSPYNVLTPVFVSNPAALQTREMGILSQEARQLSGEEFDNFLRITEPRLYNYLIQRGYNLSALPIPFYGNKINFLAPTQNLNCKIEINSHFINEITENTCIFNETQQPVLNLTIPTSINTSFQVKAHFYDNFTHLPLIGKKILFKYGNQSKVAETDLRGLAEASFEYSSGSGVVLAEFITDFETKSTTSYVVVPSQLPDFINFLLFWASIVAISWLIYNLVKKYK